MKKDTVAFGIWFVLVWFVVLQAVLAAPGDLTSVQSEWQVQAAYLVLQNWLSLSQFGLVVLVLRLIVLVVSLCVSALLAFNGLSTSVGQPLPWLAAFVLLGLPGFLNQGGDLPNSVAALPGFGIVLLHLLNGLSLPGLLLLFFLFPDGKFFPTHLRLPAQVMLGGIAILIMLSVFNLGQDLAWGWAVLMLLFIVLLLSALVGQALRIRALAAPSRPILYPLFSSLVLLHLWLLLSIFFGELASLLGGFVVLLSVPLALAWSILRWDLWQARPVPSAVRLFLMGLVVLVILAPLSLVLFSRYIQVQEERLISEAQETLDLVQPRPVIIDTDMALDDILAIMYLLHHPGVDLLAITVAGTGEAHCEAGVRHVLGLLEQAGAGDTPVACGRETPLSGNQEFPSAWRAQVDRLYGLALPQTTRQPADQDAVALLSETLFASPEKVAVITLGPLTNLAEALQTTPTLVERVEMVYIMGGAVDVPGNVGASTPGLNNPYAEWNIFVDPYAASLVLKSGIPTTWVALDATQYAPANFAFFEKIQANQNTLSARFAYNLLYVNQGIVLSGGYFFWDALAAAVSMDESLARFEAVNLALVLTPGPELGRTRRDPQGAPARLATWADQQAFERSFLLVLNQPLGVVNR